jgi:hypothetical protein
MKQVTLNIPENKYELFMEFIKNIDLINSNNEIDFFISKEEQTLILDRIKKTKKEDLKQLSEVIDGFNLE